MHIVSAFIRYFVYCKIKTVRSYGGAHINSVYFFIRIGMKIIRIEKLNEETRKVKRVQYGRAKKQKYKKDLRDYRRLPREGGKMLQSVDNIIVQEPIEKAISVKDHKHKDRWRNLKKRKDKQAEEEN